MNALHLIRQEARTQTNLAAKTRLSDRRPIEYAARVLHELANKIENLEGEK
jgi:hypothetical protein